MDNKTITSFKNSILKQPERFCVPSEKVQEETQHFLKQAYDEVAKVNPEVEYGPFEELVVDGCDTEQIWQQLNLQNQAMMRKLGKDTRKWLNNVDEVMLYETQTDSESNEEEMEEQEDKDMAEESEDEVEDEEQEDEDEEEGDGDEDDEEGDGDEDDEEEEDDEEVDEEEEEEEEEKTQPKKATKNKGADDIEDGFFNWDDMDKAAEEEELSDSDENEDIFYNNDLGDEEDGSENEEEEDDDEEEEDEMDDEDEDGEVQYSDLYADPKKDIESAEEQDEKEGTEPLTAAEEEEVAERGILSSHQNRQAKLQKMISGLEQEALGEKSWELKGEVKAGSRPENSLLEAVLEYDRPTRVAPTITPEVTAELEDVIKQRILEDNFDDVIRKFAPTEKAQREQAELSQEKSKEGLADIYEKEYMKTAQGFEETDESKQDQEEIQAMFNKLSWKLDALSHYQFTPKPVVHEMQVKASAPAISMEEAVPMAVSDANLRAPEEVFNKKRGRDAVLQSNEEMSSEQRKSRRRAKKTARRKERQQKEADERLVAKINPGLGNKYEKKKMLESLQAHNVTKGKEIEGSTTQYSKSSQFFSRLQDDVNSTIQQAAGDSKDSKKAKSKFNSAALKL